MTEPQGTAARIIAALIAGTLIYGLAMGTTYPMLGVVLADRVSQSLNGLNAAATGLGLLLGVGAVPVLARRIGAGSTALIGIVAMALSLVALASTRDFLLIFAARLTLGIGANLLFVVAETALNVLAAPERRGRVMGVYTAAVAFGFVVGPAVVAAAPEEPFAVLLGCAVVTALALLPVGYARRPVDVAVEAGPPSRIASAVLAFPFAFGFLFVASAIDAVVISLLPVISVGQSFSLQQGALFVTIFHVGLLTGQPLVGFALDGLGRRRTVIGCCAASLGCALLLSLGQRLGFWPVAALMLVWGGANYGLYTAGLALIGDRFAGEALTAATVAFAAVYALASVIGPGLAGVAADLIGAKSFYLAVAAVYLTTTVVGVVAFRPAEPTFRAKAAELRNDRPGRC